MRLYVPHSGGLKWTAGGFPWVGGSSCPVRKVSRDDPPNPSFGIWAIPGSTGDEMPMTVVYRLPPSGPDVDPHVPPIDARVGKLEAHLRHHQQSHAICPLRFAGVEHAGDMSLHDDKGVPLRNRVSVPDDQG